MSYKGKPIVVPQDAQKFNFIGLAPAYSAGVPHAVGDHVTRLGNMYECIVAITTPEEWNEAHWAEVSVEDLLDEKSAVIEDLRDTKVDKTVLAYTNRRAKYLYEYGEGQEWDVEEDTDPAYTKTVPSGALAASVEMIGGKSVVRNQLVENGNFNNEKVGYSVLSNPMSLSVENSVLIITNTQDYPTVWSCFATNLDLVMDHIYLSICDLKTSAQRLHNYQNIGIVLNSTPIYRTNHSGNGSFEKIYEISKCTATGTSRLQIYPFNSDSLSGDTAEAKFVEIIDLTVLFGSSIASTITSLEDAYALGVPREYIPYNEGEIVSAEVTGVASKDADGEAIASMQLPEDLLEDYPLRSAGSVYDSYEFVTESRALKAKHHKRVEERAYQEGDESDNTVITDGTTTYSPLASEVVTDVTSYFPASFENILNTEPGGTLVFAQSDDGLVLKVPNEIDYLVNTERVLS